MKKNSSLYRNLYGDLIGLETNKDQTGNNLFDFLGSVYSWEYASYIAECFAKPLPVDTVSSRDKQFVTLNEVIQEKIKTISTITVLDYGCGADVRIGQCLVEEYMKVKKEKLLKKEVKYIAYDLPECVINKDIINTDTIPCLVDIIQDLEILKTIEETFDIIFLFNVLHEMDILEWEERINLLLTLLKNGGYLVFCERKVLSKGEELPGSSGYLVLSVKELEKLFISSNVKESNSPDSDSLYTTIITKDQNLKNITNECILEALEELKKNTKEKIDLNIDNIKKLPPRSYAFYCQQYFNADHAIALIKTKPETDKFPSDLESWSDAELMEIESLPLRDIYLKERNKRRNI